MSLRSDVAGLIALAAPRHWRVLDHVPASVTRVDGVLAYVVGQDVAPGPTPGVRLHTMRVVILTGLQQPDQADDALDLELDVLTDVLDDHPAVQTWKATRDVFGTEPGWHGYGVEFDLLATKNGYPR